LNTATNIVEHLEQADVPRGNAFIDDRRAALKM